MDRQADVVFLHELLHARQRLMGRSADDQRYSRSFAVVELRTNVVIVILGKIDGASRSQNHSGVSVLCCPLGYLVRGSRRKVYVLQVQVRCFELLHEVDQVGLIKISEGITGDSQPYRT